eukprot:752570-Hanusia_phi.AAC.2
MLCRASANIVMASKAETEGFHISFVDFFRVSPCLHVPLSTYDVSRADRLPCYAPHRTYLQHLPLPPQRSLLAIARGRVKLAAGSCLSC